MARVAIIFGLVLCGLTVAGLVSSTVKNGTQFLAIILGIPILFLGVVALNPHRRKQAMHVTAGIAALGSIVGAIRSLFLTVRWAGGQDIDGLTFKMVGAITVVSSFLLVLCVHSFLQDRRGNRSDSAELARESSVDSKPGKEKRAELEAPAVGPE